MKNKPVQSKRAKEPWPTGKAMQQVYENRFWGTNGNPFYSGEGSHHISLVDPYVQAVNLFLSSFKQPLIVCDLGCGDFNIGKQVVAYTSKYVALDIVPALIEYNRIHYVGDHLEFHCANLATDLLPAGDCALLRQVLQHLSNSEIKSILSKLKLYKYVILTEHIPEADFIPNIDIISGQGTRLKKGSGVQVLAKPFQFQVKECKNLLELPSPDGNGIITTTLFTMR